MSSSDRLITAVSVGKKFSKSLSKSLIYGCCDMADELNPFSFLRPNLSSIRKSKLRKDEFWALSDINFVLNRGECIGLLGRNGAGKTTLLKLLNGLMMPDAGTIDINGRMAALIALGAGFNPILSGYENIFVSAAVYGYSLRYVKSRLDDIIEFSEIDPSFLDAPVQSYSSGMQVRLGFSVAAVLLRPDIILLDEILAVGDERFQAKCHSAVKSMISNGAGAILVSHNSHQILRYCNKGLLLHNGFVEAYGSASSVLSAYQSSGGTSRELFMSYINSDSMSLSEIKKHQEGDFFVINTCIHSTADVCDCFLEIAVDHAELGELLRYISSSSVDIRSNAANVFCFSWQSLPLSSCVLHIGFVLWNFDRSQKLLYGKLLNTPYSSPDVQVACSLLNIQPTLSVSYSC